ncbi:DUF3299 domain-containing protein [Pseudoroseicyclus tamaricis]|uniref:DUF3299 domain-containing protein n=1 Tax=Pseudoroseicyclus tamaricis TaxID=2705421 RepID=A0A6B2K3H2_9RHOB|nr:DUF3299 domain-containing protein [Pseudoroseicyclus tamaricis]NDV01116.1 DUF3299 domain-containing protein [Pseudoroseicyclus tamaricis]
MPASLRRRTLLALGAGALAAPLMPRAALAADPLEITWDDLVPPGTPWPEIAGQGVYDEVNDIWRPEWDENGLKMNTAYDGKLIRMPGYIIPMVSDSSGVTEFILVPYVGACIHVPPPPPNQLVYVTTQEPWGSDDMWTAIWVTGLMEMEARSTEIAEIGYRLTAQQIEEYQW